MAVPTAGVTSLSWIPSELIRGPLRVPFDVGLTHYDDPPPDRLDDLDALRRAGRFRFVNRLRATAELHDGRITAVHPGPGTGGVIGLTNLLGGAVRFPAVQMPDLLTTRISDDGAVAVVRQTAGGRAPLPAPRLVRGAPVWSLRWCGRRSSSRCTRTVVPPTASRARARSRATGCTTTPAGSPRRWRSPTPTVGCTT